MKSTGRRGRQSLSNFFSFQIFFLFHKKWQKVSSSYRGFVSWRWFCTWNRQAWTPEHALFSGSQKLKKKIPKNPPKYALRIAWYSNTAGPAREISRRPWPNWHDLRALLIDSTKEMIISYFSHRLQMWGLPNHCFHDLHFIAEWEACNWSMGRERVLSMVHYSLKILSHICYWNVSL